MRTGMPRRECLGGFSRVSSRELKTRFNNKKKKSRIMVGEKDEPAPMPARLNPKPAMSRKTAVKLTPAERSTSRTSVNASVIECIDGFDPRLTGLLEEFQKVFGVGHHGVHDLLIEVSLIHDVRHEGVHDLLIEPRLIPEVAEPGSDIADGVFGVRDHGVHDLLIEPPLIDEVTEPGSDVAEVGED